MRRFSFAVIVLLGVLSCIKENRTQCPCRLHLDMTGIDTSLIESVSVRVTDAGAGGYSLSHERGKSEFETGCMLKVPRRRLWLNVYSVGGECLSDTTGMVIPYGSDCPPVYMYSSLVDADCEQAGRVVKMSKNHCRMTVLIEGTSVMDYSIVLRGNVCGYSAGGFPLAGDFRYEPVMAEDGSYSVTVPRQRDGSLMMDVVEDGRVLKSFAIGEYVCASGYDWDSPDLSDIVVYMDYAKTSVSVFVKGWDEVYEFDIVI